MPSSLIVEAFALEGVAAAAATLGVRVLSTIVIGSLMNKDIPGGDTSSNTGGKIQLQPATNNKLPVTYGEAWVSPVIVDAKISADQQTMWYLLAISETTGTGDITIGNVYWDDKRLLFDPSTPEHVWGWFVEGDSADPGDNVIQTGVGNTDAIRVWFYKNGFDNPTTHHCVATSDPFAGSEGTSVGDPRTFVPNWDTTMKMTNTVFAVVQLKYDQDHGVTSLGQMKFHVKNTLNKPGDVMVDYLTNDRYGAGMPSTMINTQAFTDLNTYSDQMISIGGTSVKRYEINGIVDTGNNCLNNLTAIADACDSWLQWNETVGQWGVIPNKAWTGTPRLVTMDNILGGVQISPLDLNATYNSVNVQFPNKTILDQSDFRLFEIDPEDRFTNEPNNQLSIQLPLVNSDYQATYIGWKRLYSSRNDISINFTMDYSGIQIDAGDVICVNHDWYGWVAGAYGDGTYAGKPFRVTQVKEAKDTNGFLRAQITAVAYNDRDYIPGEHYSTSLLFSGLPDPQFIGNTIGTALTPPDAPSVSYINTSSGMFWVQGLIPNTGNVIGMEFWYSVKGSELGNNNYTLYTTQNYTEGSVYPKTSSTGTQFYEEIQVTDLPNGTYYWRTRAQGETSSSDFSPASTAFSWENLRTINGTTQIQDASLPGTKVTTGDPQKTGGQSGGFFDTLGPVAGVALAGLSAYALYNKYGLPTFGTEEPAEGGGNDRSLIDYFRPKMWTNDPVDTAQVGDTITYVADATPSPGPIENYANFEGYDTDRWDVADGGWGGDWDFLG